MLNLFLVLTTDTILKSIVFQRMVTFLVAKNQLESVMITQVKDIMKLSADWSLSTLDKIELYLTCADALDSQNDSNGAFDLYFEAFRLVQAVDQKKFDKSKYSSQGEKLLVNAIKSPKVINFQQITSMEIIKLLQSSSQDLNTLITLFMQKDVKTFKKEIGGQMKTLEQFKINPLQAIQKKQYITVCESDIPEFQNAKKGEVEIDYDKFTQLLSIEESDVEEWVIEAMADEIIDCKIDQVNRLIRIKATRLMGDDQEWLAVKAKVQQWKARFQQIEGVLARTPSN
jgi:hypothetical protein